MIQERYFVINLIIFNKNHHRIYTWIVEKFMSSLPLPFGKVWPMFLSGRTILRANSDLKTGPKLKIINDTVTSIIGKREKTRLARMTLSLPWFLQV